MEFGKNNFDEKKFSSLEEEVKYLRSKVSEREKIHEKEKTTFDKEKAIEEEIKTYAKNQPEEVLAKTHAIPEHFRNEIVLDLKPEDHDTRMGELIEILYKKGVLNAISIVDSMNEPHLTDDFHRFLVAFIRSGYEAPGSDNKQEVGRLLHRTLYEITLPQRFDAEKENGLQEMISLMEQFYSGMLGIKNFENGDDYITFELANAINSREFIIYASVPDKECELFEKQLLSVFPLAQLNIQKDDYNIFSIDGESEGAYLTLQKVAACPIKTYENFTSDPMKILVNVFSKLSDEHEGAAIQMVFKPVGDFYVKNYLKGIKKIEKGEKSPDEIYVTNTTWGKMSKKIKGFVSGVGEIADSFNVEKKKNKTKEVDTILLEAVKKKIEHPIVSTNIRLVASSKNPGRAKVILTDLQSAFHQFDNTKGNSFKFEEISKKNKKDFFRNFSYRKFDEYYDAPMNLKEVASVFHISSKGEELAPQFKKAAATTAPVPLEAFTKEGDGICLGVNNHQGKETSVYMAPEDRLRHFYAIGQTGTGKTVFLKNMIIQDIKNGDGVCFIDPHGNDVQDILAHIPKERQEDVIYFDPSYTERPMGLNMLEYDTRFPEQKTFVVNEMVSIFNKLFDMKTVGGPMFEQYFRNAAMLVIEDPETGNTLLEIARVMAVKEFRQMKIARCKNPIVVQFWKEIAEKAGGEASLANVVPYITSKFDVFLTNDIMRPVISQGQSSFNFRKIMDEKKILLVNLSKGRLGDINSNLLGLIIVGKILMAALSRVDSFGKEKLPPFYLYIDEFQNITTDSISSILSEARKYGLSLNIAHQYIAQLEEGIRDSVFGNVGSMAILRVSVEDAEFLETYFKPTFSKEDIMNIQNLNCYMKMLARGVPIKPFNLSFTWTKGGNKDQIEPLKQLSYLKYGRRREEVEEEIMQKYRKKTEDSLPSLSPFGGNDL